MVVKRVVYCIILVVFGLTVAVPPPVYSQDISYPPANILSLTPAFHPVIIQGMRVHPENPLQFDFIVDTGDTSVDVNGPQFKTETTKLIKYFLACLTVPDKEMWVNLSPYEKDRIMANGLGQTELGRDMLSQDYILKQLTSSLIYPDSKTGKIFWAKVYAKTKAAFGTTNIPINTFNKVWIVPDKAVVYQKGNTVYVLERHLKVMLEADYLAMVHATKSRLGQGTQGLSGKIIHDIVLPELEQEVNTGKNFANLRQIYNSMILAVWFKVNLQKSLLGEVYADKNKTKGIDAADKSFSTKIYEQYLKSFKKGVYNFIREENDPATGVVIPRKYFSGGLKGVDKATLKIEEGDNAALTIPRQVGTRVEVDSAMMGVGEHASTGSDRDFEEIKGAIAKILNVDSNSPIVVKLAHVEVVRREFLKSQENERINIKELFATIHSQGPPKIAEIHYTSPPNWSGVDIVMAEEVQWLTQQGIPVKIISGTPSNSPPSDNLQHAYIKELGALPTNDPIVLSTQEGQITAEFRALEQRIYTQIKGQIADQDIIIIQNVLTVRDNLPFTAALHRLIEENPKKQFIVYIHNAEDHRHDNYPFSLLNPTLSSPNVRYATVNNYYRNLLGHNFGVPASNFSILNPGVHPYSPLAMTTKAVEDFKRHGLLGGEQVITLAFPTRVAWNKDIRKVFLIIEALKKGLQDGVQLKLVIAAPGVDSFDNLLNEVRSRVGTQEADYLEGKRSDVEKDIVFLDPAAVKDYQEHRQYILDIMALSDYLLYPTKMETFGMFVLEAATTGTDIIASNLPSHEESLGGRALLFENDDERLEITVRRILDRIARYKENQASRDDMQRNVLERYDWNNLMESQLAPLLLTGMSDLVFSRDQHSIIARIRIGDVLREKGFLNEARRAYEAVLLEDPNNTQARIEIAGILVGQGVKDQARALYEEVLRIDPPNSHAREGLSHLEGEDQAMIIPDIKKDFREGDIDNHIVRYDRARVSAHISVSNQPKPTQEFIIAMPTRDSEVAFYLRAFSGDGNFTWKMGSVTPVVENGFRGVDAEFSTDKTSMEFNFADQTSFDLRDVIGMRMHLYDGHNVSEQEKRLMDHINQLSQVHKDELEDDINENRLERGLKRIRLSEIIIPKLDVQRQADGSHLIKVTKTTFDGDHNYHLYIQVPSDFTVTNENGLVRINGNRQVELHVSATTDFEPLTPVPLKRIFNEKALEEIEHNADFRKVAENFTTLFYQEKVLAGSWIYFAYFGRDTLVGARLMWTALSSEAKKIIVRSVLGRIGGSEVHPDVEGLVAVNDEETQERFFYVNVTQKFNEMSAAGQNPDVLGMYRAVLRNKKRGVLAYRVLDNTFLFPGIEKLLFDDLDDVELQDFLDEGNGRYEENIKTILRHWNRVLALTDPYTQAINKLHARYPDKSVKELSDLKDEFPRLADQLIGKLPGAPDVNWRDSPYGIGWGEYAADINMSLATVSIENIAAMITRFKDLGIDVQAKAKQYGFTKLEDYLAQDALGLRQAQLAWPTAVRHFTTHLGVDQMRSRIAYFLLKSKISDKKKQFLRQVVISKAGEPIVTVQDFLDGAIPGWLEDGISFTNIALGKVIMHNDETYSLMDKDLDSEELNRILDNLFMPYPLGLWNDDVGLFIANAIFSDDEYIKEIFDEDRAYHGQNVIWSKPMGELTQGLIRQIRYAMKMGRQQDRERLEMLLRKVIRVELNVGVLRGSEIWTWEAGEDGHMIPRAYKQVGGQPSGNPQLWGTSDARRQPEYQEALKAVRADMALVIQHRPDTDPGGIDLNASMLNLQTKGDGRGIALPANVDRAMKVNGFTPIIIRIKQMNSPFLSDSE